jgi:hypothetical protein
MVRVSAPLTLGRVDAGAAARLCGATPCEVPLDSSAATGEPATSGSAATGAAASAVAVEGSAGAPAEGAATAGTGSAAAGTSESGGIPFTGSRGATGGGSRVRGSTYPCGSLVARTPKYTYGFVDSTTPLGPTVPTAAPSRTWAPRATPIDPRWRSVAV